MSKIIRNGRLYDTDTADYLGTFTSPHYRNDFNYYTEDLYRKKNGEFFLSGEGGGLTKYAERFVDGRGYGHAIIPLSDDEAKSWVEQNLDADDYIELFGEPED